MKYTITKNDGTPIDPKARYFVLRIDDPEKPDNRAARAALVAYARNASESAPHAARAAMDLLAEIGHVVGDNTPQDAEVLIGEIDEFRRKVRDLNRDIDAGHEMNIDRWPWRTTKGRRVTLKNVRERLHYLEQRMDQVFKLNTQATDAKRSV